MSSRALITLALLTMLGMTFGTSPRAFAQTGVEPTKRPYTFPTPVFIPTYANDTPQPPTPTRAATPAATAPDAPAGDERTYTVQPGDSLWIIAQKMYGNGAKYPLIANANNITPTTRLKNGMVLKIPAAPGVVFPTATAAPVTPTPVPPSPSPSAPAPSPTPLAVTPTRTPAPGVALPGSFTEIAYTAINILSALLFLASIFVGALAYLAFMRTQRWKRVEDAKPSLRLR